MSWFWRGFQSAVFYYVSCAPCTKLAYRRKRRKEYKREKAERAVAEQGLAEQGLYVHPSPFSTNAYWKEEMTLGPGPPPKRSNKERDKGHLTERMELQSGGAGSSTVTGKSSADTIDGYQAEEVRESGDGWNRRRYQREDEVLWGLDTEHGNQGPRTGLSPASRSASGHSNYYYARNPAVNDLHPPVVSTQPTSRAETRWMLQPPPKARIMEGKEKSNRSRSVSGVSSNGSSLLKASDPTLSRQASRRPTDSKLKRGDQLSPTIPTSAPMSRNPSAKSAKSSSTRSTTNLGQRHDRDAPVSYTHSSQESLKRKPPPPPITITSTAPKPSPAPSRPPLFTISSSSNLSPSQKDNQSRKTQTPHLRPLMLSTNSVSSLHILQEIHPTQRASTKQPAAGFDAAVEVKLPAESGKEDQELVRVPEVESRFPERGWGFPSNKNSRGENENGKKWSMDI